MEAIGNRLKTTDTGYAITQGQVVWFFGSGVRVVWGARLGSVVGDRGEREGQVHVSDRLQAVHDVSDCCGSSS